MNKSLSQNILKRKLAFFKREVERVKCQTFLAHIYLGYLFILDAREVFKVKYQN